MSMQSTQSISLASLADQIGATAETNGELEIRGIAPIHAAGPHDLTFLSDDRHRDKLATSKAGAVLIDAKDAGEGVPMTRVTTPNPRLALAKALDILYPSVRPAPVIHPSAVIPDSCTIGERVSIGAYVVLGERVSIGDDVILHAHAVVYDDASIGAHSVVHSHATVREHVEVGAHCVLHNGAVVGGEGFGFAPRADGSWHPIRHIGSVRIGDHSEVQSNACVDRGALNDTVIGTGTKIDNLAQIGHGGQIGDHTLLCGQVGLAGSCSVGNHVIVGGQVGVADHLHIGDRSRLAAQSGVIADLEGNADYAGAPAVPLRRTMLIHAILQRLPEIARSVRKLTARVEEIEAAKE